MMEATLILATIVQKFKLELLSEPLIVPLQCPEQYQMRQKHYHLEVIIYL